MNLSYLQSKPIFEFNDLELKAIGFEISETIQLHEKNLNLVRSELLRRSMSNVVATTDESTLKNMMNNQFIK